MIHVCAVDTYHGSRSSFLISTNTLSGLFEIKYLVVTVPHLALTRKGQRTLSVQKANLQQNRPICQRQQDFSPKTSPCSMLVSQLLQGAVLTDAGQSNSWDCKMDFGTMWIKITQLLHSKTKVSQEPSLKQLLSYKYRRSESTGEICWCPCPSKSHTLLK